MVSVLILFCCITYRSAECNFSSKYDHVRHMPWKEYISAFPSHDDDEFNSSITATLHQLANAIPILLTVYMCHFNVLPVHNELQDPSPKRVPHDMQNSHKENKMMKKQVIKESKVEDK